jgi:hypothetical protein
MQNTTLRHFVGCQIIQRAVNLIHRWIASCPLLVGWIFGGGPMVLCLICIVVNNVLIFRHVQSTFRKSNSHHGNFSLILSLKRSRHLQAVAIQGACYVCTGLFCYVPTVLLRAIESVQPDVLGGSPEGRLYVLLVLQAILLPSQNSIIMLIYIWPRYIC